MSSPYYFIHFSEASTLLTNPIAFASNEWISEPQQMGSGFNFMIDAEGLNDYLMNNSNLPLMSEKMKALLSGTQGGEKATWYHVDVIDKKGRAWPYYIPYFKKIKKVVNKRKSEMADDVLVRAVLDAKKLDTLEFFPIEPGADIRLVVSKDVKSKLEEASLTGLEFVPAEVA